MFADSIGDVSAVTALVWHQSASDAVSGVSTGDSAFAPLSAQSADVTESSAAGTTVQRPLYLVAITTCNQWHLTDAALTSLAKVSDPVVVVVMDDNSEDDTVERARQRGVWVIQVRQHLPHGACKGLCV